MGLFERIRTFVKLHINEDHKKLAKKLLQEIPKKEMLTLLAWEIQQIQRDIVREKETSVFTEELLSRFDGKIKIEADENLIELMKSSFSMGDGNVALWGNATIEEHQQRIDMLKKQRDGIDETISFHIKAIEFIQKNGVKCLNDMLVTVN